LPHRFCGRAKLDDKTARREYLDESCADNPSLRIRVETLLRWAVEASDFLEHPAADLYSNFAGGLRVEAVETAQASRDQPTETDAMANTKPSLFVNPAQSYGANGAALPYGQNAEALALGTLFGRYRIERVLGSGGMGVVYLAEDLRLGRQVALKIPKFDADGKLHLIERFRREARAMASVQHRNLCPIIDFDVQDGNHYLTMAYITGETLSQIIKNGSSFTTFQVSEWIRKLAQALDAAHKAGVVHRDLKPANVIIDSSGEPILMDFGLAWMAHETDARVTLAGAIIGTPAYMSPEQAECEPDRVGAATDIYSLGVILYELLAGCPMRTGSVTRVLHSLMHKIPARPSEIRSDVDLHLESVCWKAIARRPEER